MKQKLSIGAGIFIFILLILCAILFSTILSKNVENMNSGGGIVNAAATNLKLSNYQLSLGQGETYQISANQQVTWNSSAANIAATDQYGNITAVSKGIAPITAYANGTVRSCRVTVKNAPQSVKLNKGTLTLGVGESYKLNSVIPDNTAAAVRTFRSSNSKVIKMTRTDWIGEFKAVGTGTAWVTVRLYNGKEASCRITVKAAPESVRLDKTSLSLGFGEKFRLSSILPDNSASALRTFRSSNKNVIQMIRTDWVGDIKAVGKGTAWVTVRLYNGKEASCRITVKDAPQSVRMNYASITLGKGESFKLSAVIPDNTASASRNFSSSDSSIIKMSKTTWCGEFKAVGTGTAWVAVRLYNGKQANCKITVKAAPMSVFLDRGLIYLKPGEKAKLVATVPENTFSRSVIFRSSDNSIVRMLKTEGSAEFTAVSDGTAWVTVRLFNGIERSCKVVVGSKHIIEKRGGVTYIDGVLIVNKTYPLPENYGSGLDNTALSAFNTMASDASRDGIYLNIVSGYRSYYTQAYLYDSYCQRSGQQTADRFSARPGHSEHQTGLAMDINSVYDSFADTPEAKWLENNCWRYGFIIRYPRDKENITGYKYESWHIRYVGKTLAKELTKSGQTLEEYFGITSVYS